MIVYIQNKAFPHKTFVASAKPTDKVARVRAQLLHILFELGKDNHVFQLRHKGQILRDAFSLEDYAILDNGIITMVPVGKSREMLMEIRSMASTEFEFDTHGQPKDVKDALEKEVKTFDRREGMVSNFKALLNVHLLFVFLSMLTVHWYSVFWLFLGWVLGIWFLPNYSRIGGFVGNTSHLKKEFCIGILAVSLMFLAVTLYFCISGWIFIASDECSEWVEKGRCTHKKIFTAAFFTLHALALILTLVMGSLMLKNFTVEVGDFIERFLVQERDIDQVLAQAKGGKVKERRSAAYDLAAMAASSEDNKFRIVAEGGLEVLTTMTMSRDEMTQEHAVEALAELLTIPSIQDTFVESGRVPTLSAVLHSHSPRAMQEAAFALYTIVADSEENKYAVIEDHGLDDLVHAAHNGTILCQRTIASIFLELIFNSDIRSQIASRNTPAQGLVHLCKTNDPETLRFALQSLEVLAIESPELIWAQDELIGILLELPYRTMDEKLFLLAGKILLYYAENYETCEQLVNCPEARGSLEIFAKTRDPILQKVTIKIIFCCLEYPELKERVKQVGLEDILNYIHEHPTDKETWEMAEQSLQMSKSQGDLSDLPTLSTLEKLTKMEAKPGKLVSASQSSLASTTKKDGR